MAGVLWGYAGTDRESVPSSAAYVHLKKGGAQAAMQFECCLRTRVHGESELSQVVRVRPSAEEENVRALEWSVHTPQEEKMIARLGCSVSVQVRQSEERAGPRLVSC